MQHETMRCQEQQNPSSTTQRISSTNKTQAARHNALPVPTKPKQHDTMPCQYQQNPSSTKHCAASTNKTQAA